MISVISDHNAKTGLILVDVPVAQKQYAVKQSKEDMEKFLEEAGKASDFKATGEKQTIAGYSAEKYTYKDAAGLAKELWATKDIELPNVGTKDLFPGLNAVPVKYTSKQRGIETISIIKSINEGKVGEISTAVPAGYEETTMQALMSMGGGE
ncbi:DUF4412 domain-containing protein [Pedobacter sp. MW01-1-1]|uniref:DUF4412 domain-containing protein n=1 Tax=Pedobacter sp. MW01-1-1 TaxID=3383027 RepID=UPI003FEDA755